MGDFATAHEVHLRGLAADTVKKLTAIGQNFGGTIEHLCGRQAECTTPEDPRYQTAQRYIDDAQMRFTAQITEQGLLSFDKSQEFLSSVASQTREDKRLASIIATGR